MPSKILTTYGMTFGLWYKKKKRETKKMKFHQNEDFLRKAIEAGSTSKEIAKELRVSYKLVELYLRKYGIKHNSMQTHNS